MSQGACRGVEPGVRGVRHHSNLRDPASRIVRPAKVGPLARVPVLHEKHAAFWFRLLSFGELKREAGL